MMYHSTILAIFFELAKLDFKVDVDKPNIPNNMLEKPENLPPGHVAAQMAYFPSRLNT